jgi:hypothetical protein
MFNGERQNLLSCVSCETCGPAAGALDLAYYRFRIEIGMMRLEVIPILAGATPLEVAKYTQVGIVLLSEMSISALCLYKSFAASIAPEWAFNRITHVSGSFG